MNQHPFQFILSDDYLLEVSLIRCHRDGQELNDTNENIPAWYTVLKEHLFMNEKDQLAAKITILLNSLGLSPNLCGYSYLRRAIEIGIEDPSALAHITKLVYPDLAKEFHTTVSSVERAIRHAIDVIWERGNKGLYFQLLYQEGGSKPSNSAFVAHLTEYLRIMKSCRRYNTETTIPSTRRPEIPG